MAAARALTIAMLFVMATIQASSGRSIMPTRQLQEARETIIPGKMKAVGLTVQANTRGDLPTQAAANAEKGPNNGGKVPGGGGGITQAGIYYHNGPLIFSPTVYFIWYGSWAASDKAILTDLVRGVGATPWYNIQTTYTDGSNNRLTTTINFTPTTNEKSYSTNYSKSLTDGDIFNIVVQAIKDGLPSDPNGVYFVMTSQDVTASSGFCTQYCGWHDCGTYGSTAIKYSFVGDMNRCPGACAGQTGSSPNGNVGIDGTASVLLHELVEAQSDPCWPNNTGGWWDKRGYENADKCAWTFGTYKTMTSNGARYNLQITSPTPRNYYIQQNWVNAQAGYCATGYPSAPSLTQV